MRHLLARLGRLELKSSEAITSTTLLSSQESHGAFRWQMADVVVIFGPSFCLMRAAEVQSSSGDWVIVVSGQIEWSALPQCVMSLTQTIFGRVS
jgi:hypothetical protein